jgi:hypothetical protein
MLGSVLLVTALTLSPGQSDGTLKLSNVRSTYGLHGGTRPEGKLLPGDVLFVGFDIENIVVSPTGYVKYEMAMEVLDKNNKPIFKQDPAEKTDFVPLGGSKLPARAFITIGLDQEPGAYTLKLTVTDLAKTSGNAKQSFSKAFEVAKKEFGIVAVYPSVDERGEIHAPTAGTVGQSYFLQCSVVSFERSKPDPKTPKAVAQPDLTFEMTILDATGRPTLAKPTTFKLTAEVMEKDQMFTMRFVLPMTRAGKYVVRLKAVDGIAKKESAFDLPMSVIESPN